MLKKSSTTKITHFQSEGRLLQELGERLVASWDVALVELIKNAYDADTDTCTVSISKGLDEIKILDDGHGMTESDFLQKWMRIATGKTEEERFSKYYSRKVTGAKGIGRFAVRFLGKKLLLETVATISSSDRKQKLTAVFNWEKFDFASSFDKVPISYTLENVSSDQETGTSLRITSLRSNIKNIKDLRKIKTEVMKITSPIAGLEKGFFNEKGDSERDKGFKVKFLEIDEDTGIKEQDLAEYILQNYWARLKIELINSDLTYTVYQRDKQIPTKLKIKFENHIEGGLFADVRYFPRRAGMFAGKEVDGHEAWSWIRLNHGVAIVDHGFRIKPYGYDKDDWLQLNKSEAHSERKWVSGLSEEHFPMPKDIQENPGRNWALNIANNLQLIGAVCVESQHAIDTTDDEFYLIPSTDREGFRQNQAFDDLFTVVRGGVEYLAKLDKLDVEKREEAAAELLLVNTKEDIRKAIEEILVSPTLDQHDKTSIITRYKTLSDELSEVTEYHKKSRENLQTMSMMGIVAGYMRHESYRIQNRLEQLIIKLEPRVSEHPEIEPLVEEIRSSYQEFKDQLEYVSFYISSIQSGKRSEMRAKPQIRLVTQKFDGFAARCGIKVRIEAEEDLKTPNLSPALYSGVILNLYTNALKALTPGTTRIPSPTVVFKLWNEKNKHIIEVLDNGPGIPDSIKDRIWDPLFSTTSHTQHPLGSGMGLGLNLVRKLLQELRGNIRLIKPPAGYSTCFRVEFLRLLPGE